MGFSYRYTYKHVRAQLRISHVYMLTAQYGNIWFDVQRARSYTMLVGPFTNLICGSNRNQTFWIFKERQKNTCIHVIRVERHATYFAKLHNLTYHFGFQFYLFRFSSVLWRSVQFLYVQFQLKIVYGSRPLSKFSQSVSAAVSGNK